MTLILAGNWNVIIAQKEIEVVKLLCEGLKTAQVATELKMNSRTLETDIARLKKKTGSKTIGHLVYTFMKNGLID